MASITINTTEVDTINFAYFAKPKAPIRLANVINGLKESLEISRINLDGYKDVTLEYSNFRKISNILKNPRIRAKMVLPVKVFVDFKFDKFVYLKYKDLQGLFFVEKINDYKDGKSLVIVDLLKVG
jgi:hypothetical protein